MTFIVVISGVVSWYNCGNIWCLVSGSLRWCVDGVVGAAAAPTKFCVPCVWMYRCADVTRQCVCVCVVCVVCVYILT
jgi:hypothetical protein